MREYQNQHSATPKFKPRRFNPSQEQIDIQTATSRIILVDANAGAAKTTTLALRVAESLMRGVQPEDFILLTVTNAAQDAFRERLHELGIAKTTISRLRIATFEMLAIETLRRIERVDVPYCKHKEDLRPVALQALEQVCEKYAGRYDIDASTTNLALDTFIKMQMRLKATLAIRRYQVSLEEYTADEVEGLLGVPLTTYLWHRHFEKLRGAEDGETRFRAENDAAYDLVSMIEDEPALREYLPNCKVVVCDELHDLNEVTFRLLVALIEENRAFFCGAGDRDQVIFSWSGADHDILKTRFHAAFPSTKVYPLTRCYRHGPSLSVSVGAFKNKANESGVNWDTRIDVLLYDRNDHAACAKKLIRVVEKWRAECEDKRSVGILLRHPGQSVNIEAALINAGLPYRTEGMESFLQRQEILMFRGMLAVSLRNMDAIHDKKTRETVFDALALFSEITDTEEWRNIDSGDRELAISQPDALEWYLQGTILRLATNAKSRIGTCVEYLRGIESDVPAGEVLQQVSAMMKIDEVIQRVYVDRQQASFVKHSIAEFVELARNTGLSILAFTDWLGKTEQTLRQDRAKKNITVACADDVKGKEYDLVIIPYLEHNVFPRHTHDDLERLDESNRFYVAITRARTNLVLLTPEDEKHRSQYLYDMCIEQSLQEGRRILRAGKTFD
ncbi:MAG TPA: ATP-dependent helicase [Noviherbaspirillum sp.]